MTKKRQAQTKGSDDIDVRDYFASAAMQGLLAGTTMFAKGKLSGDVHTTDLEDLAGTAYDIADAMMKVRHEKPG